MFLEGQREKWKGYLQEIEQKRNELVPEYKGCRKEDFKSCKVCTRRRRNISRTPVRVIQRWERSEMKSMKERHASWSWRKSRAVVGWQQMIWKKKSGACKQGKKEEAAVRLSPIGAASIRLWSGSSPWERHMQQQQDPRPARGIRQKVRGSSHSCALEKRLKRSKRKDSRQICPPARGGRNESFPAGSVFDPAGYQDANGESG